MENNFTDTELANEVWRDIAGYEGMYQVSDLGRVRSKKYGYWRVMKPRKDIKGYLRVGLCKENKVKRFSVHRLVAQAFIPNDDESKTQINHRNECKSENRFWNLEWCSAQYNMTYNNLHYRRWTNRNDYKRPKIEKLYNPNLSYKQNLELFSTKGIECSINTVKQLRKDLGLTKQCEPKLDKIKPLYRPDLSIAENLEIFKENGIECSRDTVKRLRRYLGLTRKYTNRDKIKDIYRPDLSINENLKMFKEQGIECCKETVVHLRKDLGLTRKYTKRS